jgi:hypothetical protein
MPAYMGGTITHFQDNQAETNFWANFIADANNLGTQTVTIATEASATGFKANATAANQLITEIENYEHNSAAFDQSVGGLFAARFDNELLNGALQADAKAAIDAIKTGNIAEAQAAMTGFIADATDVSGNNIPKGGGAFVATATMATAAVTDPAVVDPNAPTLLASTHHHDDGQHFGHMWG